MTLISLFITNYNYGRFLRQAIESVLQQTYERLELFILDDASCDNSAQIMTLLHGRCVGRFEHFETIFSAENRGKLHLLNRGIPLLDGEIAILLDADDYLEHDYVEKTVAELLKRRTENERIAFVYTDSRLVDSKGAFLGTGKSRPFDGQVLQASSYIPDCAPTLTSTLREALPFDESIRVATKHHKWLKLVRAGWHGSYLDETLFNYRMHTQNLSGIGRRILNEPGNGEKRRLHVLSDHWQSTSKNGTDS